MLRVHLDGADVAVVELPPGEDAAARLDYVETAPADISVSLPRSSRTHVGVPVAAYFRNLLPEGRARERIETERRLPAGHDQALLAEIGRDCAGALSILPADGGDDDREAGYEPLTDAQVAAIVVPAAADAAQPVQDVRISLAGAQSKVALRLDEEARVHLPRGGAPSTHIFKPESSDWPGLATNELFCQRLAAVVGVDAAHTSLREVGGTPTLVSTRFDRAVDARGTVRRIHQEDACQALGVTPSAKYEAFGGPTIADLGRILDDHGAAPAEDRLALLRLLTFAIVIGNADLHGKNVSFLHLPSGLRLAPAYDLIATVAYPRVSRDMAMHVGDAVAIDDVGLADLGRMARHLGIRPQRALSTLEQVAADAADAASGLRGALEHEGADPLVLRRLEELVRGRARHLHDLA